MKESETEYKNESDIEYNKEYESLQPPKTLIGSETES